VQRGDIAPKSAAKYKFALLFIGLLFIVSYKIFRTSF